MHVMAREFDYAKVLPADTTYLSIAPMIMRYGTDEKRDFIPGITRGELFAALGYFEPDAGTHLAILRTRAVLDGTGGPSTDPRFGPAMHGLSRMALRAHRSGCA